MEDASAVYTGKAQSANLPLGGEALASQLCECLTLRPLKSNPASQYAFTTPILQLAIILLSTSFTIFAATIAVMPLASRAGLNSTTSAPTMLPLMA